MAQGVNITGINSPEAGDTDYVQKIIESFTAVDNHDHSPGKGLPVSRLANGAVTAAALASGAVTSSAIAAGAVTAPALGTASVATVALQDASVTLPKLGLPSRIVSTSCGAFTSTSTSGWVDVTNLHCTITTTGSTVRLSLTPDSDGTDASYLFATSTTALAIVYFQWARTIAGVDTSIGIFQLSVNAATSAGSLGIVQPIASLNMEDTAPAAGTYTYRLQASMSLGLPGFSRDFGVNFAKLVVQEIP